MIETKRLAALAALSLALPVFAQQSYDCSALEFTPGQYNRGANGDKAVAGRFFHSQGFLPNGNGYPQQWAEEWRKQLKARVPDLKAEFLVTDCGWAPRLSNAARFGRLNLAGEGGQATGLHYADEFRPLSKQEVPFELPPKDFFPERDAVQPPKWYVQCVRIMGQRDYNSGRYEQGVAAEKTRVLEFPGRSEAYEARRPWQIADSQPPNTYASYCAMGVGPEAVAASVNLFQYMHRHGIPVTAIDWVPAVKHAELAKPSTGKPAAAPALTIEGPSKSDLEHAAREKARLAKAAADEKKALADQAKRDADAKAEYDKIKADAEGIKAKAKAEREANFARCAARGIPPEKCPQRASAQ